MIDENGNYVTKSKLTITVKTFSKYNDKSRVAAKQANKQTQRHSHKKKIHTFRQKSKKAILTNRLTSRLEVDKRTHRGKQKVKNESLCSDVIKMNK